MQEPGSPSPSKKKLFFRRLRNITIAMFVLLFVAVGAGVGYTWYMGQTQPAGSAVAPAPTPKKPYVAAKPAAPPPNAKVGVAVESFASPVAAGDNSSISVQTTPGSICSIVLMYGAVKSTDSGLVDKTADEYGLASWSWTVPSTTPNGSYPLTITCKRNVQSGVYQANLVIGKDPQNP